MAGMTDGRRDREPVSQRRSRRCRPLLFWPPASQVSARLPAGVRGGARLGLAGGRPARRWGLRAGPRGGVMIISFSLRRPSGSPRLSPGLNSAGAAPRVLGSGLYTGGGSTYARRAADARPVTGSARPACGGGGGRRLATVTPILDLPLGGWGEPGFNWRLFWGTQDTMLWKITDNVKYEEDCEVSWAQGRSPAPPEYRPGGGGPLDRGRGRGRWTSKRALAAACPSVGRSLLFRAPPYSPSPGSPF